MPGTTLSRVRRSPLCAIAILAPTALSACAVAHAATSGTSKQNESVAPGEPAAHGAPTVGTLAVDGQSFDVQGFTFGVENPTTIGSATGGAGAGKAKFGEFTITKTTDSATPAFFKNCVTGTHYKDVLIVMRKAGGDPSSAGKPFLSFHFDTVFTTKIDWSGPGDEGPEESISFNFERVEVTAEGDGGLVSSGVFANTP
jgi:type VI protein secretion system component Hcp